MTKAQAKALVDAMVSAYAAEHKRLGLTADGVAALVAVMDRQRFVYRARVGGTAADVGELIECLDGDHKARLVSGRRDYGPLNEALPEGERRYRERQPERG